MRFEKRQRGLLREAFHSEEEGASGFKPRGKRESIGPGKRGEQSRCFAKFPLFPSPPHLQRLAPSTSLQKTSRSNPRRRFLKHMENDVTLVRLSKGRFHKKNTCILLICHCLLFVLCAASY